MSKKIIYGGGKAPRVKINDQDRYYFKKYNMPVPKNTIVPLSTYEELLRRVGNRVFKK